MANPITQRMTEKRAGIQREASPPPSGKLERLPFYQKQLLEDQSKLKRLATVDEKKAAKLSILETYAVFVADYIDAGHDYMNTVAVQVMIWLFDILNIESALKLAFVLAEQKQLMPNGFTRDMPTFICDAVYDWASELLKKQQSASPYLEQLVDKLPDWAEKFDLHPAVVSKCYVMLAKHKNAEGDFKAVVALCDEAIKVNPEGYGCKTLREKALALVTPEAPATA